jgi:hypothetical protein
MKLAYSTPWGATNAWFNRLIENPKEPWHGFLDVYSPKRKLYAKGPTIYSYGNHFPLIRWIPEYKAFTINIDTYSQTTSRHQNVVKQLARQYAPIMRSIANSGGFGEVKVFRLDYSNCWLPELHSDEILAYYNEQIRHFAFKTKRARSDWSRQHNLRQAEGWITERNEFIGRFAIPLSQRGVENALQLPEDVTAALVLMKLMEK